MLYELPIVILVLLISNSSDINVSFAVYNETDKLVNVNAASAELSVANNSYAPDI